jgi:glycosyltransferase involved in cell wall biosynthesis
MPKVDVVIPAFNAARYLPAALESVEAQTFVDWRIVLVDDGSTDHTPEVVSPFRERLGDRLRYIRKENAGLPAARNTAVLNSSSEFLALLDADDVWLPGRLETSLRSFDGRPQVGLSYGMIRYIDAEGQVSAWEDRRQKYAEGRIATHIYTRRTNLPCPTVTFRRKCVDDVGLFDETMRATEDRDMWLRIALRYEVCFVEQVIAHYRLSPTSMSTDLNRMITAQLEFVEKHRGAPGCGALARRAALARIYKQCAEALSGRHQPSAALKASLRAVSLDPSDWSNLRTAGSLLLKWAAPTQP